MAKTGGKLADLDGTQQGPTEPAQVETENKPEIRETKRPRLLIGPRDSQLFWISKIRPAETADGYKVNRRMDYPIALKKTDLIEGLPAAAGGCAVRITEELAEDMELPLEEVVSLILAHRSYGRNFVFLDDEKSKTMLEQMRRQAAREANIQMEALTDGVVRSDMALPEDRIF